MVASRSAVSRSIVLPGLACRAREPEKEYPMLRKFAVALLAASMFTAPVLAQGTQTANPPAKTGAVAAAPKAIAAKPALKAAKVKHAKRHVARVKHVKHVRHVRAASSHRIHHARHV